MNLITKLIGVPLGLIMWLMYQITHNYALAIVLFTLITKVLLFPLSVKQQKSSAAMSAFTPKLEQLKKQYANNQQKLQEEQMKLYAEEGINPMASCLPLFIQFPLLFGIFDVVYRPISHIIRASQETITGAAEICRQIFKDTDGNVPAYFNQRPEIYIVKEIQNNPAAFSGLGDPEFVDAVSNFNNKLFGVVDLGDIPTLHPEVWNAAAVILLIIPVLSGLIQLFMTIYSQIRSKKMNPDAPNMAGMNMMLYIMPLFSVYIAFKYPAGIGFYWTISSLFSCIQSMILYNIYTPEYVAELVEKDKQKRKKKSRPDLMTRYQQLLEEQAAQSGGGTAARKQGSGTAAGSGPVSLAKVSDDDGEQGEVKISKAKQREYERMLIREARRRQAEKYGEEFIDDDDD